ncbi:uncharacterized protein GGS22DRAFT_128983 [Annulohypoxylon maeteangense]|uniref:uncharacterized protein n=1 Tax=Annulohypoxylon maeteangense TaxID=1927788 RepID=UPI002007DF58|nr:uncharacterized protein GGS22DRAFT_128983 [Annulohypoxylon maeteangense]KAI0886456.1 hypothetical protein GGS22DRAFT_128983 [Annulohypoxylon maeteangense]
MSLTTTTARQRAAIGERLSELTTVFTPPCPITWLLTSTKVPSQYPAFPTTGPSSCDPPSWVDNISQKGFGYYSPAICPSGFYAGCTAKDDRIGEGFPPTSSGETAMYCVPSGFACTSDTTDFRGGIWGFQTGSGSRPSATVGPAIQIRWRQQDLSSLQTDPLDPNSPANVVIVASSENVVVGDSSSFSTAGAITSTITSAHSTRQITSATSISTPIPAETETDVPRISSPIIPTGTEVSMSTSQSSPSSQRDAATPILTGSTSTTGSENNPSPSVNEGSSAGVSSSTNTAAMALSGILIVIILGFLATVSFRRYRRYRAGKIEAFIPFKPRHWAKAILGKWSSRSMPSHRDRGNLPPKLPDAELGTDGPIPELGPGDPLGTKENPAELAGNGVRNSWMSNMSRIFTGRLRKEVWSV